MEYWFGDDAVLPESPAERISFLLSAGLSEASAPHMVQLLTAAICHQQRGQQQEQLEQQRPPPQAREATKAAPSRSLAALAALLLRGTGTLGATGMEEPLPSASGFAAEGTLSLMQGRQRIWVGRTEEQREIQASLPLSSLTERAAALSSLSTTTDLSGAPRFIRGRSTTPWRVGREASPASDPSSGDEVEALLLSLQSRDAAQKGRLSGATRGSSNGGTRRPVSRPAAIAMQERRSRKMLALLQRHQNALAGREDTIILGRRSYAAGAPLGFVVSPAETLQLIGEACRLKTPLAKEFLLLSVAAHAVPPEERGPQQSDLPQAPGDATDLLGLAAAGRHALERCCEDYISSSSCSGDRSFFSFLQRLLLRGLCLTRSPSGHHHVVSCGPMQLYALARATETVDVALPLLEELTSRQQQLLLQAAGKEAHGPFWQQAAAAVAEGLRPFFSALFLMYREVGQFELQRSALQLLALHRCLKAETTEALLRFWWDTDDAALRQQTAKVLLRRDADPQEEENEAMERMRPGERLRAESSEDCVTTRLLRDAHLQSLQRMMQYADRQPQA